MLGFFKGLTKTRKKLSTGFHDLLRGKTHIDDALLSDIETILLTADVGIDTCETVIDNLRKEVSRKTVKDPSALLDALKHQLQSILEPSAKALTITSERPFVILMIGVNGSGKTTTIGKLASQLQAQNYSVMLAAGDTFRAAAIEQLQAWGERNDVPVIAQHAGADSASVIFDALNSAKARNIDVVIADTAGRLHTQSHLMEELKKIDRVIKKFDENAPHEVMLVLDASIGQNALQQAQQFGDAVNITGVTMTKLDGTAKGGTLFSIANTLKLPIRFVGFGEKIEDLKTFDAHAFVDALINTKDLHDTV